MTNARMELGFSLDNLGIPYIHKAELLLDKEVIVESTKPDNSSGTDTATDSSAT